LIIAAKRDAPGALTMSAQAVRAFEVTSVTLSRYVALLFSREATR
jgi:hypothetical protein